MTDVTALMTDVTALAGRPRSGGPVSRVPLAPPGGLWSAGRASGRRPGVPDPTEGVLA